MLVYLAGMEAGLGAGLAAALRDAGASVASGLDGPCPDAVVYAAVDPVAVERVPLAAVDDARFEAIWEKGMRATIECCQSAFRVFRQFDRRGSIVIVVPTIAMSGAAGWAPYSALAEGQRLLAKSAARQWGAFGIRVNCLAVAPELVLGDQAPGAAISLAPPAFAESGDVYGRVGGVLLALLDPAARYLTGATITADGGVWMSP